MKLELKKQPRVRKRIKKKKVIKETKKIEKEMTRMVAHPLADLTLTSKVYDILQLFLTQKQIKKGRTKILEIGW